MCIIVYNKAYIGDFFHFYIIKKIKYKSREEKMNINVFKNISYGVYIIATMDNDKPTGCTANSVMQVTATPATIAVSINHDNYTNECIRKTKLFSISIVSETSDSSIIGTFGFSSGREIDKFQNITYDIKNNIPVIKDSCGYVMCKVIDTMETNTHTVFLGEVIGGDLLNSEDKPMTYSFYHEVIKGKSPKNAPTYLPDKSKPSAEDQVLNNIKYVCQICGYIYEGDILPRGYKCPICGQSEDCFGKVE